ncbi:SpoIIE family protein phosphatase [Mycobacterium botniense]|uniref:Stage II sporulation protein E n=1 Tax=Mycobacterium botniense TaxID=84962 RepID=A0A7I9XWG3_9MYCO|nr:SpoIIE family protein phosphatase [Mycobacterium botniense]GFG74128.1 hypothetical protein MBOT_14930 [Mycobacterium botniense]
MTDAEKFRLHYAAALHCYLDARDQASLAVGHELGREALREQISMLDIVEHHFQLIDELAKDAGVDGTAALEFLLQTLAALDVVTRGFLDGTRRYEEQRARLEDLADRDEFRTALVNSLQEGFFVADHDGAVIEINDAFTQITGYPAEGLPYRWPHPWLVDKKAARQAWDRLNRENSVQYETPIRHQGGTLLWVAVSINVVTAYSGDRDVYVGTVRDVTAERAFAARESAVLRLATAVSVAKNIAELLSATLDECGTAIDAQRVVVVMWPPNDVEPVVQAAGQPPVSSWRDLDPLLRQTLEEARHHLPLTVRLVESADMPGESRGIVAVLSGAGDALWLEFGGPRRISAEDRLLVTMLVGHLGLAMHHVRQFETARETSLTLQRAMLAPLELPAGFAVRYEPAVPPLEIGGDWYDVLPIDEHRIGIVVGDCVGRGLPAAAVMGQLRSSARALLLTGAEPALLLEQLDSVAELIPGAYCTTVFLATLETETGVLQYSSAGHVPAVLATPQSGATLLSAASSVPLVVHRDRSRPQASQVLPPGATLMLFTDGLVERKHDSIDAGIARAAEVLTNTMNLPVEAVADAVLRELTPAEGYDDDVAIVLYRRILSPLRIETDATADYLVDIRHQLASWLSALTVPEALISDIVLAVNEACTNSVEHAYRGHDRGTMMVDANVDGSGVRVRVADSGSWKTPGADDHRGGRGLPLIRAVSHQVDLNCTTTGTTVEMRFVV